MTKALSPSQHIPGRRVPGNADRPVGHEREPSPLRRLFGRESSPYLSGELLYGNDFGEDEIRAWYADEENAYVNLRRSTQGPADERGYHYRALAAEEFAELPHRTWRHVLGFGAAYGEELAPIVSSSERISIVESSPHYSDPTGRLRYHRANPLGHLDFPDGSFDLIVCLSVLHHVPNVEHVVREMGRCLEKGGFLLVREPTISMGDWRKPRAGLTLRERGIPIHLMRRYLKDAGLRLDVEKPCMFSLTRRLAPFTSGPVFNSAWAVKLDHVLSRAFRFNRVYHAATPLQKLRPTAALYIATKE